jgi:hypothetical protein
MPQQCSSQKAPAWLYPHQRQIIPGRQETILTHLIASRITPGEHTSTCHILPYSTRFFINLFPCIPSLTAHRLAVSELGGPSEGVYFVPHGQYTAQGMLNLGPDFIDANYPIDHTHTSPALADIVAQAFVLGLKCGTSPLLDLVVNASARIEGPTLGTCILANSTLPV